jgi:hypothetical protein
VSAQPFRVLVADVGERDEEVLPGPEHDLFAEEIEGHKLCSLRDFSLFFDLSSHA